MKLILKKLIRAAGYDLRKYRLANSIETLVAYVLDKRGIDMVIDVGANQGQFGLALRDAGYRGRMISVEPLAGPHEMLRKTASGDANWTVAERMALGAEEGSIQINRSQNTYSSSILPILPAHTDAEPASAYEATETVPIHRFDEMLDGWGVDSDTPILLKLDVQGYEDRVLDGIGDRWPQIVGIQTELSLLPLYEGQKLHDEMLIRIQELGFDLHGVWAGYVDRSAGRMLQYDAFLMRRADHGEEE